MKFSYLHFFYFLTIILIISLTSCSSESNLILDKIEASDHTEVIYLESEYCCHNLRSIEQLNLPDLCELPYDGLFAINLDDFEIFQNYSFGDTLSINFNYTNDCEAQGDDYNCIIECDIRHGIPIQIVSIELN